MTTPEQEKFVHLNAEAARARVEEYLSVANSEDSSIRDRLIASAKLCAVALNKRHSFGCAVGADSDCSCGFYLATDYAQKLLGEGSSGV